MQQGINLTLTRLEKSIGLLQMFFRHGHVAYFFADGTNWSSRSNPTWGSGALLRHGSTRLIGLTLTRNNHVREIECPNDHDNSRP